MLNEVLYCKRLMYLEWMHREFADNAFTVEGRYVHERADAAGGELPPIPAREEVRDGAEDDRLRTAVRSRIRRVAFG